MRLMAHPIASSVLLAFFLVLAPPHAAVGGQALAADLDTTLHELDDLQTELEMIFESICDEGPALQPDGNDADDACAVARRLLSVAESLASIREECFPPYSINFELDVQTITRALNAPEPEQPAGTPGSESTSLSPSDALNRLETVAAYHARYASDFCTILDAHRDAISTLEQQHEDDRGLVQHVVASRLGVLRFAETALALFANAELSEPPAFRIFRTGGGAQVVEVNLNSGAVAEFVAKYLYVDEITGVFRYYPVESTTTQDGGRVYQALDGLLFVAKQNLLRSNFTPAEWFLGRVAKYVEKVIRTECTGWLASLEVFRSQFFAARSGADAYPGQEQRLREALNAVYENRESVTGACENSGAVGPVAEAFNGVLDRTYGDLVGRAQEDYAKSYLARFALTDLLAQPIQARREAAGMLGAEISESKLAVAAKRLIEREKAYAELEKLRVEHAHEAALQKVKQHAAMELLAAELASKLALGNITAETQLALGNITAETGRKIADLDYDVRMEEIEANLTIARERMATDRAITKAEIAQKDRAERRRSRTGILKSFIDGALRIAE